VLKEKIYEYKWGKDTSRVATIVFVRNSEDIMQFKRCTYTGLQPVYNLDDWDFLREVAEEIEKLVEKHEQDGALREYE